MMRHASAETLARFRSGSLRRGATRRVRAHLDTCARCTATYDALGEIPARLAAAQPPPIPAHLAARIETALATESAHRSAGSPSVRPARPQRTPSHAARGRRRLPAPALRALAGAAAAVVIGGGAYAAVQFGGGSGGTASGSSAASSAHSAAAGAQGTAGGPVRPGAKAPTALGPFVRYQTGGHAVGIRPVQTATNYQPGRLAAQVAAAEHASRAPLMSPDMGQPRTDQRLSASQLTQLSGCLTRVAGGQPVGLVDLAQYRGSAATVIVTKATSSRAAQVWVVGPGCSRSASDVLDHQRLPG
jgi:hypothetical protein